MNRRPVDQVLLLLASSGLSDRVLHDALMGMSRSPPSIFLAEIKRYRSLVEGISADSLQRGGGDNLYGAEINGIAEVLIGEIGLSPSSAAQKIYDGLLSRNPSRVIPPYRPKDGFRRWLSQILDIISASEVLHVVTRIRSENLGRSNLQWSISPQREDD